MQQAGYTSAISNVIVLRGNLAVNAIAECPENFSLVPIADDPVLDQLVDGMAAAGRSLDAIELYLGVPRAEVRVALGARGVSQPVEKPLKRSGGDRPWTVRDVRLLAALWLDNVDVPSIAAAFGRSAGSVHSKRRWLGLPRRVRRDLTRRAVKACRSTPLPWKPRLDISGIVAMLGHAGEPREWTLGRERELDQRFSLLAFGGLHAEALAVRMRKEFDVHLTAHAVSDRMTRLEIKRHGRLSNAYVPGETERRGEAAMAELEPVTCMALNRTFWRRRSERGRRLCREYLKSPKYAWLRSVRSAMSLAA